MNQGRFDHSMASGAVRYPGSLNAWNSNFCILTLLHLARMSLYLASPGRGANRRVGS